MRISIFGLGRVGAALFAALGAAGHEVIGVDVNDELVARWRDGTFATDEPGVRERVDTIHDRDGVLRVTTDTEAAVLVSDLSFVVVATPSNTLGGFSLRYVLDAIDGIGRAMAGKRTPHTVSLVSTVMPGASDTIIVPRLAQVTGRRIGEGLGFCYNPAFIALGEVVRGFERPDYVLIGQADMGSGDAVEQAFSAMVPPGTPVARMRPIEAEITKLASNSHETLRVTFANLLLRLCEELPGTDVDRITDALSHRTGRRFFRGAGPYGGPCWPRDNQALAAFLELAGLPADLPRTIDRFNDEHGAYVLRRVMQLAPVGATVAVCGLAYKSGTPVIDKAFGVELASSLADDGRRVIVWDPLARNSAAKVLGDRVGYADDLDHAIEHADLVVIVNPDPGLLTAPWHRLGARSIVLDSWRCLDPLPADLTGRYLALGRRPEHTSVADPLSRPLYRTLAS